MVLIPEQDKLKKLLGEAIPLLCKNGIEYKSEFSIEALIGITLDKERVLLVSINETVKSEKATEEESVAEIDQTGTGASDSNDVDSSHANNVTPHSCKRKRRSRSKSPDFSSPSSSKHARPNSQRSQRHCSEHLKKSSAAADTKPSIQAVDIDPSVMAVKLEPQDEEEEDLVFIKEDCAPDVDLSEILPFDHQQPEMASSFSVTDGESNMHGAFPVAAYPNTSSLAADGDSQGYHLGEPSTSQQVSKPLDQNLITKSVQPIYQGDSDQPVYSCHLCGIVVKELQTMKEHIRGKHLQVHYYACNKCGRRFRWRSGLKNHRDMECSPKSTT